MKHGTITIVGTTIRVEAPPHVSIKLRRNFGGAQRFKAGVFDLSATPAQAYDLDWFRMRHPLDIAPGSEAKFHELVETQRRKLEAIESLDAEDYVPREFELALPPRAYQRIAAELALKTGGLLIADDLGLGKQQPVDARVLTPTGYVPIGSLVVGDEVIGSSGMATTVTGVFPQGVKPSYRVKLSDGASVEAGPDHLWAVDYYRGGRSLSRIVVTTDQIRTGAKVPMRWEGRPQTMLDLAHTALYLPMLSGPVEFSPGAPLPIPPYLLGQLIANGSLTESTPALVTHAADWLEVRDAIEAEGADIGHATTRGNATRALIRGIGAKVRALGLGVLSKAKRIPRAYLAASPAERIALLHGLMDGDGSVSAERSRVTYHTISPGLADDVRELVEQLGGVASIRTYDRMHEDKPVEYQVRVRLPASIRPFTVSRKASRYAPVKRTAPTRRVIGVDYVRDVESVCIAVAATDRLYVTEHAILTHNTVSAICALTAPGVLPALIVTMTHLTRQWERELARFAPSLRVHRIRKGQPYAFNEHRTEVDPVTRRRKVIKDVRVPDVILINYHKLNGWVETLARLARTVVFDETQELRHNGTKKYDAAFAIAQAADLRIGLSVGPETRVELAGGPFGDGWSGPISEAWTRIAACGRPIVDGGYEIVEAPANVMARGWLGDAFGFGWKPLRKAIRHVADKPMRRVHAGGAHTDLTVDHSLFVAMETRFVERRTDEIGMGDIVPSDDGARWQVADERPFDVLEVAAEIPQVQIAVDLRDVDRHALGLAAWEWQNCHREAKYGARVPLRTYLANRWLKITGPVYVGRGKAAALPHEIKLSEWAYELGFFVGDGWADRGRVAFAVDQPRVDDFVRRLHAMNIGLRPEVRKMRGASSEVRVSHVLLARVLRRIFGGARCHEKRIPPDWIFTWPADARRRLLEGLIDSDGHRAARRPSACSYTTTSQGLAEDVRLLVRSLGAASTLHRTEPGRGGTVDGREIIGRHPRWSVVWSAHAAAGDSTGRRGGRHRFERWRSLINEAPVRSVRPIDVDQGSYVYDFEMDGHPSFVANGLLCHNTATPIYNYGVEILNVVDALAPGQLGTRKEFLDEWCGESRGDENKARVSDPAALGTYLREAGLMIRRTRKDVGRELPALTVVRHVVECDQARIEQATADVAELARRVLDRIGTNLELMQSAGELDYRLRQATGIAKAQAVADFVRLLVDAGERVVLYGWHHEVYALWRSEFERKGAEISYAMFTGKESEAAKDESRRRFIDGEAQVIILSLRAGAGLDGLQHVSRTVVFGELDWSPGVHHQDIGRVHRDGQTEPVMAYYLVAEEGSDPVIADVLGVKEAQAQGIVNPDQTGEAQLVGASADHIRKLAEDVLKRRGVAVDN